MLLENTKKKINDPIKIINIKIKFIQKIVIALYNNEQKICVTFRIYDYSMAHYTLILNSQERIRGTKDQNKKYKAGSKAISVWGKIKHNESLD